MNSAALASSDNSVSASADETLGPDTSASRHGDECASVPVATADEAPADDYLEGGQYCPLLRHAHSPPPLYQELAHPVGGLRPGEPPPAYSPLPCYKQQPVHTAVCTCQHGYKQKTNRLIVALSLVILLLVSTMAGVIWKHSQLVHSQAANSSSLQRQQEINRTRGEKGPGQYMIEYLLFVVGASAIGIAVARDLVKKK